MVMRSFAFAQDDKKTRKEILTYGMLRDRKAQDGQRTPGLPRRKVRSSQRRVCCATGNLHLNNLFNLRDGFPGIFEQDPMDSERLSPEHIYFHVIYENGFFRFYL